MSGRARGASKSSDAVGPDPQPQIVSPRPPKAAGSNEVPSAMAADALAAIAI